MVFPCVLLPPRFQPRAGRASIQHPLLICPTLRPLPLPPRGFLRLVYSGPPPAYEQSSYTGIPGANVNAPRPHANPPPRSSLNYDSTTRQPADDRTPLLVFSGSQRLKTKTTLSTYVILLLLSLILAGMVWDKYVEDPLDPAVQERMRMEWSQEIMGHEKIRKAWAKEVAKNEKLRVGWENERQELIAMREQLVQEREEWTRSREAEERVEEDRRREEERLKREAEKRTRAGFYWEDLHGDVRCLRHGARQYSARVANVPAGYNAVQACMETAVEIHGLKLLSPNYCEDRGCNGVYGHWIIDFAESPCVTYFDYFNDKGCTSPGSRLRRIESPLKNLQPGDDWQAMCSTTPADFRNMHFEGPGWCENWGKYGAWGLWDIEDDDC
ncbi:hypothetical protein C8J57DRAFT_1287962 [Mycena rebaudengoi]|nr:hypothetical protein C8J57DRAFT_1287962 [Mycena rebaudengoi]